MMLQNILNFVLIIKLIHLQKLQKMKKKFNKFNNEIEILYQNNNSKSILIYNQFAEQIINLNNTIIKLDKDEELIMKIVDDSKNNFLFFRQKNI